MKIKRILALLLVFAMALLCMPTNIVFADDDENIFESGDGTSENPYTIKTLEQLEAFRDSVNNKNSYDGEFIRLTSDIDMSSKYGEDKVSWTSIGTSATTSFLGTFDGNGHKIENLYISTTGEKQGLFGYLYMDATIKNLGVFGTAVIANQKCALLVGHNLGNIINCYTGGSVTIKGTNSCAGLVGDNSGEIKNCYNQASVSASDSSENIGGLVGYFNRGYIENSYNVGDVTAENSKRIAGLIGYYALNDASKIKVENCYNTGTITAEGSSYVDAVVGRFMNEGTSIYRCYYLENCVEENTSTDEKAISATLEQFNNGEITWLLQEKQKEKDDDSEIIQVWGQEIGVDNLPVLTSNESDKVCKVSFMKKDNLSETQYSEHAVIYINNGKVLDKLPENPTFENYTFDGWVTLTDDEEDYETFDKNAAITDDITVYAVQKEKTVTDGNISTDKITLDKNKEMQEINLNDYVANKSGATKDFTFALSEGEELPTGLVLSEDGKISGTPTADAGVYAVKFDVANNSPMVISLETTSSGVDVLTLKFDIGFDGDGSEENPYLINSLAELETFRDSVNSGNYYNDKLIKLMTNIDFSGKYGDDAKSWNGINGFNGTFDGNGKKIENIYSEGNGLFGNVRNNGIIKNLSISGRYVVSSNDFGCIAAENYGIIENCYTYCTVDINGNVTVYGGIAGQNYGEITDCESNSNFKNLEGVEYAEYYGGIVGYNRKTIKNCTFKGSISGLHSIGGIAGRINADSIISGCKNIGTINGVNYIGGIVGFGLGGKIYNCINSGAVGANNGRVGGILGVQGRTAIDIKNCYNTGTVTCPSEAGGIIGYYGSNSISVSNSWYLLGCNGENTTFNDAGTLATLAQFKSGEVAWSLQNAQMDVDDNGKIIQVWGQNLKNTSAEGEASNVDEFPVLTSNETDKVCKVAFMLLDSESSTGSKNYAVEYTNKNSTVPIPENPTSENYKFRSWSKSMYKSDEVFDENSTVTEDTNLYAFGDEITVGENALGDVIELNKNVALDIDIDLRDYVKNKSETEKYFAFDLVEGEELPTGLNLTEDGKITGTPTADAAVYTVKFIVVNNGISLMSLESTDDGNEILTLKFKINLEGDGSEENPYLINSLTELETLSENVSLGNDYDGNIIKLVNNVDMSEKYSKEKDNSWNPIGKGSETSFKGIFDGNGKKIENIYANGNSYLGVFGYIGENGIVKNLSVSGSISARSGITGGIAGWNEGKIQNCHSSCVIKAAEDCFDNNENFGGIAGASSGTIEECSFDGSITASNLIGGIVGSALADSAIRNCTNSGSVTQNNNLADADLGGIAGWASTEAVIKHCYNIGTITSSSSNVGGIVGLTASEEILNNYYLDTCGGENTSLNDFGTSATLSQFNSGEVAWKLQSGEDISGKIWGQKIGSDTYPVFTSDTDKKVVTVKFLIRDKENKGSFEIYDKIYLNTGKTISKFPEAPTSESLTFKYWVINNRAFPFDENTPITEDTELYAVGDEITQNSDIDDYTINAVYNQEVYIDLCNYYENKSGNEKEFMFALVDGYALPNGLNMEESGLLHGTIKEVVTKEVKFTVVNNGISVMSLDAVEEPIILTLKFDFKKADVYMTTNPEPKFDITYTGEDMELLEVAAKAENGTVMYGFGKDGEYSEAGPTAKDAGTYEIWYYVKGDENFNDTEKECIYVVINSKDISKDMISFESSFDYDGTEKSVTVSVKDVETVLEENVDYIISGELSAVEVGEYDITVEGIGNYSGVIDNLTWSIKSKELTADMISFESSFIYDGTEKSVTVSVKDGETVLEEDVDYIVSGVLTTADVGEYDITVEGIGNYSGLIENLTWSIISDNDFVIRNGGKYSSDAARASAEIYFGTAGTYTVIFADYENGCLTDTEIIRVTVGENGMLVEVETTKPFTLGKGDKVMLWSDLTDIAPLCDVYEVK